MEKLQMFLLFLGGFFIGLFAPRKVAAWVLVGLLLILCVLLLYVPNARGIYKL